MVANGCSIGASEVAMSTLLKGASIGDEARLRSCLVGEGAVVGRGCDLDSVVIDHGAEVPDETVQKGGTWPMQG